MGGSSGPHEGRFPKRMFQLNSRHRYEAIDTKLDVFLRTSIWGRPWGAFGGSPGPHEGRFSKRMSQLNSRHRNEAIDTKLDVFLRTSILGRPPGGHPRRPQIENQKLGSERRWGLVSSIIMSSFIPIHRVLRKPLAFFKSVETTRTTRLSSCRGPDSRDLKIRNFRTFWIPSALVLTVCHL